MIYIDRLVPLALVATLAACATSTYRPAGRGTATIPAGIPGASIPSATMPPATTAPPSDLGPRLLVRQADLGVEVEKLEPARRLTAMIEAAGGRTGALGDARHLTLRVPARHVLGPLGLAFAGLGWVVQKLFFIR